MKILIEYTGMNSNWEPEQKEIEVPDDQCFHEINGEKYIVKGSLHTQRLIKILEEGEMKCIKLSKGIIDRVSDEKAEQLVKSGKGVYVSKSEWKEFMNKKEKKDVK